MTSTSWLLEVVAQHSKAETENEQLAKILSTDLAVAWDQAAKALGLQSVQLAPLVASFYNLACCDGKSLDESVTRLVPQRLAKNKLIAPLCIEDGELLIAVANPVDEDLVSQVKFASGRKIRLLVADPDTINTWISRIYASELASKLSANIRLKTDGSPESDSEMQRNPVVILARKLLYKAVSEHASDIHIQPHLDGGQVRFRNDGILHQIATLPLDVMERIIRYFMTMTGMDSSQLFLPQDGSATLYVGSSRIDLRISTLPNRGGERLVIRLLDQSRTFGSSKLDIAPRDIQIIEQLASHNSGMILFAGPTGSGKTTSLYSLLLDLNDEAVNIITVENPVEYRLPGLSQVEINPERGLTFQNALRSILRQDPDILLVGEIRDSETAEIATRAALTGHLLFSTLHTMDACNAIPRLLDLGVSQPVLGETLLGVVSQRLLRKLCASCAVEPTEPYTNAEVQFVDINDSPPKLRATGCEECGFTGYKGRVPILEILEMNQSIRQSLLDETFNLTQLNDKLSLSFKSLSLSARDLIYSGITSSEEVQRVLGYRFWVEIAEAAGRSLNFTTSQFGKSNAGGGAKGKILLVRAAQDNTSAVLQELENGGYEILQAQDLHEAHKIVLSHKDIQVVIVDVVDNKQQPLDFLSEVRAELAWAGLPCIFLLQESDEDMHEVLHTHFMDDYIKKPFTNDELVNLVRGVISR